MEGISLRVTCKKKLRQSFGVLLFFECFLLRSFVKVFLLILLWLPNTMRQHFISLRGSTRNSLFFFAVKKNNYLCFPRPHPVKGRQPIKDSLR
jgi:hypothetical protein